MVLKLVYTLLIGIFLAVFIGVGIATFYEEPKSPEMPVVLKYCSFEAVKNTSQYKSLEMQAKRFDRQEKAYREKVRLYNKNVSIIAIIASIIIVVISLTLLKNMYVIADGVLFGGVLVLIYSVIRGFETEGNMFRFIIVSIGLFISLFLGFTKFIMPGEKNNVFK